MGARRSQERKDWEAALLTDKTSRPSRSSKANDPTGDVPAPTLRALLRAVRDAEVLYVAFPRLQRALVVDPRPGPPDFPAVLVATLAFGAGGEAAAIEQLRPGRPPSARAAAVTWGGSTRAFAEQGMLPALLGRLPAGQTAAAMAAFEELREAERGAAPPRSEPGTAQGGDDRGG